MSDLAVANLGVENHDVRARIVLVEHHIPQHAMVHDPKSVQKRSPTKGLKALPSLFLTQATDGTEEPLLGVGGPSWTHDRRPLFLVEGKAVSPHGSFIIQRSRSLVLSTFSSFQWNWRNSDSLTCRNLPSKWT